MLISEKIKYLMNLGSLPDQPYSFENRRILLLNKIALVAIILTFIIVLIHLSIGNILQPIVVSLGFFVAIPCLWFQSLSRYTMARNWFLTGFFILIVIIFFHSIQLNLDTSTEYVLIILIPLTLIFLDGKKSIFIALLIIICGISFIGYRNWIYTEVDTKVFYGLEINWITASLTVLFCMNFFKRSLVHANKMIESDRRQLAEANNTKNFLFGVISHDIRSPLNILKQYLLLAPKVRKDPDQFMEYQKGLTKKVDEVSQTLEELLFWSKTQLQGINTNPSSFLPESITSNVTAVISDIIEEKNIHLKLNLESNCTVFCDKDHLTIVMRNLIQNAIKFTPAGGEIEITSQKEDDHVCVTVKDTGKGIDEETLKNLREGMFIKSKIGTASEVGTGLGLSLVKELISKNNGELIIDSNSIGTQISIHLPQGN